MNLRELRESLGLTAAQAADELNMPKQDLIDGEEMGGAYLLSRYIKAFPLNPELLTNPEAEPFLPSRDVSGMGPRMRAWREENGVSPRAMALALDMTEEELAAFEANPESKVTRSRGEQIEKKTGMNRQWLMYGDARVKGTSRLPEPAEDKGTGRRGLPGATREAVLNKEAGDRIRKARESVGMTRQEMAQRIGLSLSRISQMESGYVKDERADQIVAAITGNDEEDDPKAIGQRVRDARKAAGLSVRDAAEMAGLKPTSLAHMESGYISVRRAEEIIACFRNTPAVPKQEFSGKQAGAAIREARKNAGMSQKELATILRIPVSRVAMIELGNVGEAQSEEILRRIGGGPRRVTGTAPRVKKTRRVLLGREIREAREEAGMSQKEVGDLAGLVQSRISLMERGDVTEEEAAELIEKIRKEVAAREEARIQAEAVAREAEEAARKLAEEQAAIPLASMEAEHAEEAANAGRRRGRAPDDNEDRKALGMKIRAVRKEAGLTLKQAAEVLGISASRVTQMECGTVTASRAEETMARLLAAGTNDPA